MDDESINTVLQRSQSLYEITEDLLQDSSTPSEKEAKIYNFTTLGNFVQIPKDSFVMGSNSYDDESPKHHVNINYDIAISKYQVTVREYLEFAESTNSNFPEWLTNKQNIKLISMSHYKNTNLNDDAPIVGISWENAKEYCAWKSSKENKLYRLPTEAEWEYACRAGSEGRYSFGDDEKELGKYAWFNENSNQRAHPVGTKRENAWGLHDMHGNVWEWCEDIWSDNYELTPRDGSANRVGNANVRVLRGGSWVDSSRYVRSSNRNGYDADGCDNDLGFRLVLVGRLD